MGLEVECPGDAPGTSELLFRPAGSLKTTPLTPGTAERDCAWDIWGLNLVPSGQASCAMTAKPHDLVGGDEGAWPRRGITAHETYLSRLPSKPVFFSVCLRPSLAGALHMLGCHASYGSSPTKCCVYRLDLSPV